MSMVSLIDNRRLMAIVSFAFVLAGRAGAMDFGYYVSGNAGIALAAGGDLTMAVSEFGDSVGADAVYAPVLGAALGFGVAAELAGPLRAAAGLELRRLGYAFWAPDIRATSYLALWVAGLRLGLGYGLDDWHFGAGTMVLAPVSSISQATSQGGASLTVAYDSSSGRFPILGAYLEASLGLGPKLALGQLTGTTAAGFALGLCPAGIVDGVRAWQTSVDIFVTLNLEKRKAQ